MNIKIEYLHLNIMIFRGFAGSDGAKGDRGEAGEKGSQGNVGPTGLQGPIVSDDNFPKLSLFFKII